MRIFALILIFVLNGGAIAAQDLPRFITVNGVGQTSHTPDQAQLSLGVQTKARLAHEALEANSLAMTSVFEILKAEGVASDDMRTTRLSLQPIWERQNNSQTITGYQASNGIAVTVRDIDGLGALIDVATRAGANRIDSISFGLSNRAALMEAARQAAVVDALSRAQGYAAAAGLTLGAVISISESGASAPRAPMGDMVMMEARSAMPVAIAEGAIDLRAAVIVVVALAD